MIDGNWEIPEGKPYAVASIESWTDFVDLIQTSFLDWPEYIYRGHRNNSWPLRSKFDRWLVDANNRLSTFDPLAGLDESDTSLVERRAKPETVGDRDALLARQLKRFVDACCGRRGASPAQLSADEWWALGRHVGLDTPLLDWTKSPYVACYFAMQDPRAPDSGTRYVWVFSHRGAHEHYIGQEENVDKKEDELESVQLLDLPVDENSRSISQSGLFTRTPDGEAIEDFVAHRLKLDGYMPVLFRIDLPDSLREVCLRSLDSMNINSSTLFPDLIGAAGFSNRGLEKELTKVFWEFGPDFVKRMLFDVTH